MKRILGCAAAVFLVGCAGKAVEVGSNHSIEDAGATGGTHVDAGPFGWPDLAACQSGTQLPIVGTWTGNLEGATLPSRSDAVKLVISAANASHVCGTITMGTGTPPPVPTDPDSPSIPGIISDGGPAPPPETAGGDYLIDGYPLTILNGKASLPRLQFEANGLQFWKPWCELQTPYWREGTDQWYCLPYPAGEWTAATGCVIGSLDGGVPVNCNKVALCMGGRLACSCTATGCTVSGAGGELKFDVKVTGNEINGYGNSSPNYSGPIHLTKVP